LSNSLMRFFFILSFSLSKQIVRKKREITFWSST